MLQFPAFRFNVMQGILERDLFKGLCPDIDRNGEPHRFKIQEIQRIRKRRQEFTQRFLLRVDSFIPKPEIHLPQLCFVFDHPGFFQVLI